MEFKDKSVLITGASRGIGKVTAQKFAEHGANVIINYHSNESAAKDCLASLKGENHMIFQADMGNKNDLEAMVEKVITTYGKIDILVNNAGIFLEHPASDLDFESWNGIWERTIAVNLTGPANLSFLISKHMIEKQFGKIINISSRGAFRGEPENLAYGASKGGLNSYSQSLAKALGGHGIAVFAIAPGFVETDMGQGYLQSERGEFIRNESPFKRVAQPEEVADTILFLASDKATFLTGGIIDINGASFLRM